MRPDNFVKNLTIFQVSSTDFEFKAQVKTEKRANSGMYFRTQLGGNWPKGV